MLTLVQAISKRNEVPIKKWIDANQPFKFIGDNVDVSVGVRDIRSDHQKHIVHMFSLLVVKSRIPSNISTASTRVIKVSSFFPKDSDISSLKLNLSIIVSRVLCTYIKGLKQFAFHHIYYTGIVKL